MKNGPTLAILGFHQIGLPEEWNTWFYIPEATFADQLRYLRDEHWTVLDHNMLLQGLENPQRLPERSAFLTFDDGCLTFLDTALPWLRRFQYPAVHFVPTDYIGKYNSFDQGVAPRERIFGWNDLRTLERFGVSVQSHAASHRRFSELYAEQQREELSRSKRVLEDGLQRRISLFAFPQGDEGPDPDGTGRMLLDEGYRAAFLYGGGPIHPPVNTPYRLTRVAMGPGTDLEQALNRVDIRNDEVTT
jgi:peptidoglycan/xylan/chitin deacetylase (PgdA/CDA1 family)